MSQNVNQNNWGRGIHNKSRGDRLPENSVREAINLDPTPDGGLSLRSGAEEIFGSGAVRAVWPYGNALLVHEGSSLLWVNPSTLEHRVLGTIGTVEYDQEYFDGRAYLTSPSGNFVVGKDQELYPWGAPQGVDPNVSLGAGSLLPGVYRVATTFTIPFEGGELEGGAGLPQVISVPNGGSIVVSLPPPPAGGSVNLYVSQANGILLHHQISRTTGVTVQVLSVNESSEVLPDDPREPMPVGTRVSEHRGMLAVASEDMLYISDPMNPFVYTPSRSTYRFPGEVLFLVGDDTGFVVGHPHGVSLISEVETDKPQLNTMDELPPVKDSGHRSRDGEVYWVTSKGLHQITKQKDTTRIAGSLLTQDFVPDNMASCELGGFDYNGYERIVINPTGNSRANNLVACDYYTARVVLPEDQ